MPGRPGGNSDLRELPAFGQSARLPAATIVTLDRVICCYPDMERLVRTSAEKARRLYGAVYPRERWWARVGVALMNA